MTSDAPLLIHIGYHKTATTWMQSRLFQPDHGYRMLADHTEIFAHVVQPHGLLFDPAPMHALIAERSAGLPAGHVAVLSSEILSGNPFFGAPMSESYARRLKEIAPEARILVSIRAQARILPSIYMQYILRGGTMPYDVFFDGTDTPGYLGFRLEHFEYHRLVALYQSLFGSENVYVMTQESLQRDQEGACADLAAFAGNTAWSGLIDAARNARGVSYPEYAVPILRRSNHFRKSPMTPYPALPLDPTGEMLYRGVGYIARRGFFKSLLKNRKPVSDYVKRVYSGRFAASNAELARIIPHPLDLDGYELSDA